jgi:hypothetical protein
MGGKRHSQVQSTTKKMFGATKRKHSLVGYSSKEKMCHAQTPKTVTVEGCTSIRKRSVHLIQSVNLELYLHFIHSTSSLSKVSIMGMYTGEVETFQTVNNGGSGML